jgi:hypothetical protein
MRQLWIFHCSFALSIFASPLRAQTGDWAAVEALADGAAISVQVEHRVTCTVRRVTDNELICDRGSGLMGYTEVVLDRQRIRQVRLERWKAAKIVAATAIGVGVGATLAVTRSHDLEGSVLGGEFFGLLGGVLAAGLFEGGVWHLIPPHGRIIYQR